MGFGVKASALRPSLNLEIKKKTYVENIKNKIMKDAGS
jgi:hypothetical protein